MRKLMLFAGLLLASLFACTGAAYAGGFAVHAYSLSGHGKLVLRMPAHWKSTAYQPQGGLPPTITLRPKSGEDFRVMVTPIWPARPDVKPMTFAAMEKLVRHTAEKMAPRAVEKNLMVLPLRGRDNVGYHYFATDSAPKPGEYKYMDQGLIRVGELVVSFTILTNDGQQAVTKQALAMLMGATQRTH